MARMKNIRVDYCRRARKVAFKTELDAKMALADRSSVHRDKGDRRHYKCTFGPHWHLTSQEKHDHGE